MRQQHLDAAAVVVFVMGVTGAWFFGRRAVKAWRS